MTKTIELDRLVDYRTEYSAVIKKCHVSGDRLTGLCPFHDDQNSSFSVDLKTGQWHCFAEDSSGNFVTFWAKLHGVDSKQAYREILQKYGLDKPQTAPQSSKLSPYSLECYSEEKGLPAEFLRKFCRLETVKQSDGLSYLKIPYFRADGELATYRKRFDKKQFLWRKGSSGKICLYGEWRLPEFKEAGWAILVEGESDTQTLWHLGLPALGVAGASMFQAGQAALLSGLKIYLHQEPDQGGKTFLTKVCRGLQEGGFQGELCRWSCDVCGYKDPSALYLGLGKEAASAKIWEILQTATPVDWNAETVPEAIPGAPIRLRQPDEWHFSDKGITFFEPKNGTPVLACRTPILLTRRLKNLETHSEKIEIAFLRDGKWHTAIYPRSTIFSSRNITVLSDLGCTITSENAKSVVRFLEALEAANMDRIPVEQSTDTFGWQSENRFLPGHAEGLHLDLEPSQRVMAAAYCTSGSLENWIANMTPHRNREKFRFILAASFAAPLLKILKQRIFVVYNWGGSKGGKTAALKAALSAWGDPERLMVNFNATQVGLERIAAFYCDLPLGIDEKQLAGQNQGQLEKNIYMIASGKGRLRGTKTGGFQPVREWRTVALATGEEPISTEVTQTGVSTRVLEIYGPPFDKEADAAEMHQKSVSDYGWAGPSFVGHILQAGEQKIIELYEKMHAFIQSASDEKNGAHIAGISVVALADALLDHWIFGGDWNVSWGNAEAMAVLIMRDQVENNATDVNENATQFVVDWILSSWGCFEQKYTENVPKKIPGACLGLIEDNTVYIFPSLLNQALTKAGFSPRKTMKYLAERGLIGVETDVHTGKKQYSVRHWFHDKTFRFVEFYIEKVDAKKPGSTQNEVTFPSESPDFQELDGPDGDLPFNNLPCS